MRFFFYATERQDGQWELHSSLTPQPTAYPNRDAALLAARHNCRKHWELHGTPCGVRLRAADGDWVDDHLEGESGSQASLASRKVERATGKPLRDRRLKP